VASESGTEVRVPVASETDLVLARRKGRAMAEELGLSPTEATLVATAISELARNIVHYAQSGEILLRLVNHGERRGITIEARDQGPGIADTRLAVEEGYSSSGGLGLGLPGVRRIMDQFDISSELGRGTTITVTKWKW
jgi:serine/threonine-protein kinase RsbT